MRRFTFLGILLVAVGHSGEWAPAYVDLSVVMCGRNDGYAPGYSGSHAERLRRTVLSLALGLCRKRASLSAEIVVVEWRPLNETDPLELLVPRWFTEARAEHGFDCALETMPDVRVIVVQHQDAAALLGSRPAAGNMLEWHCKNVGLRRARGDLLLVTNADDLFSPALFNFLARSRELRRDTFYLAQNVHVWVGAWVDQLHRDGVQVPFHVLYDSIFERTYEEAEKKSHQLIAENRPEVEFSKNSQFCENPDLFKPGQASGELWRTYDAKYRLRVNVSAGDPASDNTMPLNFFDLYVGDFMLASRVAWHSISGAPLILQSVAIDWLVSCRFATWLRQVVLVAPCYSAHQSHPPAMLTKKGRVDSSPTKDLNGKNMWKRCRNPFQRFPTEHGINRRDWGFSRIPLREARITPLEEAGPGRSPFRVNYWIG
eukprot:TRINITY_DN56270_c0_g1_i1.p1 TRINITY_DN56270_c0_g1~~TRINITY_DN56270_c0_g1_i1.p1  ORF type:complete len:482 (-),score=84.55 TRINITY_DN56270_c0_g1_i1:109-1395(-)